MSATYLFTLAPAPPGRIAGGDAASGRGCAFRSDTLAAALGAVASETGSLPGALAGPAAPFVVSSVFYELDGVRLYPSPIAEPPAFAGLPPEEAGFFRRLWRSFEWVTEARLESLAGGRRVRFETEDIIEGRAWGMPSERGLRGLPGPRGTGVDGAAAEASDGAVLPAGTRLFFLARLEDPSLLAPLKGLVSRLGESGLGGDRSRGPGHFTLVGAHGPPAFLGGARAGEREAPGGEAEAPGEAGEEPGGEAVEAGGPGEAAEAGAPGEAGSGGTEAGSSLLLSLYLPTREEVGRGVLDGMTGDICERGGWIRSGGPTNFRKRPVRMLVEGSVLRTAAGSVRGEARDVRPEGFDRHPVWRDGRAFAIPYGGAS